MKNSEIEANFFFEDGTFSTKNSVIEAHFYFEKGAFSTEISEIEAHFFFENSISKRMYFFITGALRCRAQS